MNAINTPGTNFAARSAIQGRSKLESCKPGFRVHFSKQDPFDEDAPWSFPAGDRCADFDKFVLRNEWGDAKTMLRNKLAQDLYKQLGAPAPRIEYAELSVNGEYFGLYTLEERVDDHFAKCRGWPRDDGASLFKSYPDQMMKSQGIYKGPAPHSNWSPCAVDAECALGFERKMPDCDGCDDHFCPQSRQQAHSGNFQHPGDPQPNPNCTCPQPTELAELFNGIHYQSNGGKLQDSATPEQNRQAIATVLNVTDWNIWVMLTTFTGNEDTGWHN